MTTQFSRVFATIFCLASAPAFAQNAIPVRQLSAAVASDSGVFKAILGVRHLSDGRVLVNDPLARRIVVLDAMLTHPVAVLDSAAGNAGSYGTAPSVILPYVADSTVFIDAQALAFVVIDPSARVVRSMASPRPDMTRTMVFGGAFAQAYDPRGRLVFNGNQPSPRPPSPPPSGDSSTVFSVVRDSVRILRADPNTRVLDTLGAVARPVMKVFWLIRNGQIAGGGTILNPLPQGDEWALLPDGTAAIVRGFDYHIDWISPDGTKSSTPKLPFDWRRVTEDDKLRMIDSARKAYDARIAALPPIPAGQPQRPPFRTVDPVDMPDYYPPIRPGTVRADLDGNVWILPTTSTLASGALVFDVVNGKGAVFERVQIPAGRDIAGFGPGGIVYLISSATPGTKRLERAKVIR